MNRTYLTSPRGLAAGLLTALLATGVASTLTHFESRVDGCGGVPPPPVCGRSTALTKTPPGIFPVAPFGGVLFFPVTVNVAATGPCAPSVSTTISLTIGCAPPPGAAGSITIPTPGPGNYPVLVPVFIPPGPPRVCTVVGSATTTWADGVTTTGTGDTTFCIVEPSPLDPTLPRLDMQRLTDGVQTAHPGDQRVHVYRFTNNDPSEIVVIDLTADSEQSARLGTATGFTPGSGQGLYSLSDPGTGDNFPIQWVDELPPGGCVDLPIDPMAFPVPTVSKQIMLQPGESKVVALAQRSWPMCGCGSMCESRVFVNGTWTDGSPALACSGAGLLVDCNVPPDFDCDDGGAAGQLVNAGPAQLGWQLATPTTGPGNGSITVLESQANAAQPLPGIPFPSENWDGFRGRTRTHFQPFDGPAAFVNQTINVMAIVDTSAFGPNFNSSLSDHTIWYPGPLSPKEWVWINARSDLNGPGIPPTIDSFFDVFTTVTLDGISGGLHRRAQILPGTVSFTPISPTSFQLTFLAQFKPFPGFPNTIDSFTMHVDADARIVGQDTGAPVCGNADHGCDETGGPGCADVVCCNAVCALDPFCCDTAWDQLCVDQAIGLCGGARVPNDDCEGALEIAAGTTEFSTLAATTSQAPLPDSCDEGFGTSFVRDLWYRYDSMCSGTVTVSTCGNADFDTRLAVYTDCPSAGGAVIACNDDAPGCGTTSTVTFPASCGATYFIRLGGYDGAGTGSLHVACDGECPDSCPSDINDDGVIDGADLAQVLGNWGSSGSTDLNGDGTTDGADLAGVLGDWGLCAGYVYTWFWDDVGNDIEYSVSEANENRTFVVGGEVTGAVKLTNGLPDLETNGFGKDDESAGVACKAAGAGSVLVRITKDGKVVSERKFCFQCDGAGADPQRVDPCPN